MKTIKYGIVRFFRGRITRKIFITGYIIIFILYNLFNFIFNRQFFSPLRGSVESLVYLILLFFVCSLTVRRLHDTGLSGWFFLIILVPGFNIIFTLFLLIKQGDKTANMYGSPLNNTSIFLALFRLKNQ